METIGKVVYTARIARHSERWSAVIEGMPGARVSASTLGDLDRALRGRLILLVDDDAVDVEYLTCCIRADDPAAEQLDLVERAA